MTRSGDDASKAMGEMEDTLGELQGEVILAKDPPANRFKPWWLLTAIVVFVVIGAGTFVGVRLLTDNTDSIRANCLQRNEQLQILNDKFGELNTLIEAAFRDAAETPPPPSPDVLEAFEKLRQPIPTVTCK
jgi:hypothetical protein